MAKHDDYYRTNEPAYSTPRVGDFVLVMPDASVDLMESSRWRTSSLWTQLGRTAVMKDRGWCKEASGRVAVRDEIRRRRQVGA